MEMAYQTWLTMIEFTEGDGYFPLEATFVDFGGTVTSIESATMSGVLIAPDGITTDITPTKVTDGTDGRAQFSGSTLAGLEPGLWSFQFYATDPVSSLRISTKRIYFHVLQVG